MPTLPRLIAHLIMIAATVFVPRPAPAQPAGGGEAVPAGGEGAQPAPAAGSSGAALAPAAVALAQRPPRLDHLHQLGISVLPGIGYRVIARYNEEQSCLESSGDDSKWVCTSRVPFFIDFQLSFGISRRIDLITDLRLGLDRDDAVPGVGRQFALAPGLRVWLDNDVRLKFFTTIQAVLDHTEQGQWNRDTRKDTVADTDFGVRNSNGLMFDAIRNVGFYLQFGETIGFVRWFRIELDVGLGVQVRFP